MPKLCYAAAVEPERLRLECGGKAYNLASMSQAGLSVPSWFAVGNSAFRLFVERNSLGELLAEPQATAAFESRVLGAFLTAELPLEVVAALSESLTVNGLTDKAVAVRSSGLDEDGAQHSFAGQYSSFLFQRGTVAIQDALKRCWASGFSERVTAYRRDQRLPQGGCGMGVMVQEMVDASSAGVMFSRHPVKVLDREVILISAVLGAGEGLVSGLLAADTFEVSRAGKVLHQELALKASKLVRDPAGGLRAEAVPTAQREPACLDAEQLRQLTQLAIKVEALRGSPQDIEWVIAEGRIHLVQTRPITTLPPAAFYDEKVNGQQPSLWDNANIVESYSDVTSPLTFSFASRAYNQVYIQFMEIMGVPQSTIDQSAVAFRNLLGLIRGRIYYNLIHWYELVLALPGSSANKDFMDTMMGVKQKVGHDLNDLFKGIRQPPIYGFAAKTRLLMLTLWRFARLDKIIADFYHHFDRTFQDARSRDFRAMPLRELIDYFHFLEDNFLRRWHAPIINDYLCMIFFGLLKKLTKRWIQAEGLESLQNDLLCGEGGLDSTKPTKFLMQMARDIATGEANFRTFFTSTSPEGVVEGLRSHYKDTKVAHDFASFIDLYGFRCINELKLEEADLHDDPRFIIHSLLGFLRTGSYRTEDLEQREREIRQAAEQKVRGHLSGPKLLAYKMILKQARRAVKNRENLRFTRTKVFGVSRHLFRAIGAALARCEVIEAERDIFYLTLDEIIGFVEGRVVSTNLKGLIALRREEFDTYRQTLAPPERFLTKGAVGISNRYPVVLMEADLLRATEQSFGADPNALYGTPCCPGIVEGEVRVAHSFDDAIGLDGHILVTSRTDPGWVPLFPSCRGLLIERGSLLSHSAVVARELGLPTIVGVRGGLMKRLKTGDRVRIDGGKGEITLLATTNPGTESL